MGIVFAILFVFICVQNLSMRTSQIEVVILEKRLIPGKILGGEYQLIFEDCGLPEEIMVQKEEWIQRSIGEKISVKRNLGWPIPFRNYHAP